MLGLAWDLGVGAMVGRSMVCPLSGSFALECADASVAVTRERSTPQNEGALLSRKSGLKAERGPDGRRLVRWRGDDSGAAE